MNFRRLVSAVAALAVAGTMCAGLAVTASAEAASKIAWDFTSMTTDEIAAEAKNWTITTDNTSVCQITYDTTDNEYNGTGLKYYSNPRTHYGYGTRSLGESYTGLVTVSGVWNTGVSTLASGSYEYLAIQDSNGTDIVRFAASRSDKKYGYIIGGGAGTWYPVLSDATDAILNAELAYSVTYNTITSTITSITLGTTTVTTGYKLTTAPTNVSSISMGNYYGGTDPKGRYTIYCYLKSVNVAVEEVEADVASYTTKYVCDDVEFQKETSATGVVGTTPAISTSTLDVNGTRYIYVSDDASAILADGTTVITVTYRKAETYTATVSAKISGTDTVIGTYSSETAYEDEEVTVYAPRYILYEGAYYVYSSGATSYYGTTLTYSSDSADLSYVASDISYFIEAEDMTYDGSNSDCYVPARFSSGAGLRPSSYAYTDTFADGGYYTVTVNGRGRSTSGTNSVDVYVVEADGTVGATSVATLTWSSAEIADKSTTVIYIPAGGKIALLQSNQDIDYVFLTKAAPTITATTTTVSGLTADPSISSADEGSIEIYTADGFESTTEPTLSGDVTTVYIKVENVSKDELEIPKVVTSDKQEYSSHKSTTGSAIVNEIGGYYYFIYQFNGIDLTDATVTYGDLDAVEIQ